MTVAAIEAAEAAPDPDAAAVLAAARRSCVTLLACHCRTRMTAAFSSSSSGCDFSTCRGDGDGRPFFPVPCSSKQPRSSKPSFAHRLVAKQ